MNTPTTDHSVMNGPDGAAPSHGWQPLRILVVALCFIINMLDGADLLIMSFIAPTLSTEWQISPQTLGFVFSASLAGMAIGCLFIAPLADRYGRRTLILMSLFFISFTLVGFAFANSVAQLMFARFILGIGIGTLGVTMTAMATEYAPPSHSSFAAGIVQAGWPLGSIITAFAAASMLETIGWRALVGGLGALSVILLVCIFFLLPESLLFLKNKKPKGSEKQIEVLKTRLNLSDEDMEMDHTPATKVNVMTLLREGRARTTLLLWAATIFGFCILYFAISWIPKLSVDAGLRLDQAIYAGATYNAGAFLGTMLMGYLVIKFPVKKVIASLFFLSVIALALFGNVSMPIGFTLLVAALIGITVQGGFNGFWALAAKVYPDEMRGTGIGWAIGIGRIGAVIGPILGGFLLGAGTPIGQIFLIFSIPAICAGAISLLISEPKTER